MNKEDYCDEKSKELGQLNEEHEKIMEMKFENNEKRNKMTRKSAFLRNIKNFSFMKNI